MAKPQAGLPKEFVEDQLRQQREYAMQPHIKAKIFYAAGILVLLLSIGTIFYTNVERWHWIDALYFSTETITTVGYGEHVPQTDIGKLFTVVFMIVGVGSALYALSSIATEIFKARELEWLRAAQEGRLQNINKIGKHIKTAAGKFKYEKEDLHHGFHHDDDPK